MRVSVVWVTGFVLALVVVSPAIFVSAEQGLNEGYLFSGFQRGKRPSQWGEARDGSRSSTYGCGERSKATRCGTGSLSC